MQPGTTAVLQHSTVLLQGLFSELGIALCKCALFAW